MSGTADILEERKKTHGEFNEHARCTQRLKEALRAECNWEMLPPAVKESLDMIVHKLGRIATGNPFVHDHYVDICGYATLVVQRTIDGKGMKP